jgi:hypothetical protein
MKKEATLPVFKVVRFVKGEYLSAIEHEQANPKLVLRYYVSKATKPKIKHTKLWAFLSLDDAKRFVNVSPPPSEGHFCIFLAMATRVQRARVIQMFNHKARVKEIQDRNRAARTPRTNSLLSFVSTVHCSSIQLEQMI